MRSAGGAAPRGAWNRIPAPVKYLVLGLLPVALFGSCVPVIVLGEGMSAFVHELGHAAVSIFFGRLAVPLIVVTLSYEQSRLAAGAIWAAIVFAAWSARRVPVVMGALALVAVLYPALAFTNGHDTAISLAGHGAEIATASFFFYRAIRGGFVQDFERPLYAMFAWYLWRRNLTLFWNLVHSAIARDQYASISFTGGDNDLTKAAAAFHWSIESTASLALIVSIVFPLVAMAAGAFVLRRNGEREAVVQ